ncbi:MAG: radical SAM protein [Nanoarchaeota archaeon]|nr:radical SAM protein [Nanoarchaeota archaeon]MBU1320894.1 radical SAM protein [Nanoarchaeota archaeon]MBU1597582.1 radical SAM protein [Nanoarchaeota archaeon]MBU2441503.1 radical SAM protein [Nanoarchaeota archaeon]
MKKKEIKGKIVYRFETPIYPANILYVNLIASYACINDCLFCSRPRGKNEIGKPNIYEKKTRSFLYLPKPPSADEIMKEINNEIKEDDQELAIIGLGEPLQYLPTVVEVVRRAKEKYPEIKVRIDTNGLVKCMYEMPAQKLELAGLDEIRISVNAINKKEYDVICRPQFKNAFENLTDFVGDCVNSKIETYVSFVIGFKCGEVKPRISQEYIEFTKSLGIDKDHVILRNYVEPLEE